MKALGEDAVADDEPAVDWMNDWQRLAAARAAFGDRLGNETTPPFQIPEADGYPITERMIDVSPPECEHAVTAASQP